MKKLRYQSKRRCAVIADLPGRRRAEIIAEYVNRAEAVSTESEARRLLQEAWGKKGVYIELFRVVAEIFEHKNIFRK